MIFYQSITPSSLARAFCGSFATIRSSKPLDRGNSPILSFSLYNGSLFKFINPFLRSLK